jgi:hypothetical protein
MSDAKPRFPRAEAYLAELPKDAILRWFTDTPIGRTALAALEADVSQPLPLTNVRTSGTPRARKRR